jgi:hypothetical protein
MVMAAMAAAALFSFPGGQAVSSAPLLPAAPASSPRPRAGLWTLARAECRFNLRSELDRWPDCADPVQMGQTALSRPSPGRPGSALKFVYAEGDPGLLQVETGRGGADGWSYYGFRPLASDADGRVIRARIWPVSCPARGCRLRSARELLAAARASEARAFTEAAEAPGRTAVWVRRSQ